jgi:hypothetical protein
MKTKKELMEMQVIQVEAIKILIAKVEDLEMVMQENASASYKNMIKEEETRKAFADKAIHSSCDAFWREDFFDYSPGKYGYAGGEYYPELSWNMEPIPEPIIEEEDHMRVQGTFHFVGDSVADLHLVCSHFADIGEDYYVFFQADWDGNTDSEWVVWTPNAEHYNK